MKITKKQLKQIIKEELSKVLREGNWFDETGKWYIFAYPSDISWPGGAKHPLYDHGFRVVREAETEEEAKEAFFADEDMVKKMKDHNITQLVTHVAIPWTRYHPREAEIDGMMPDLSRTPSNTQFLSAYKHTEEKEVEK
jgi:hypothetical protein